MENCGSSSFKMRSKQHAGSRSLTLISSVLLGVFPYRCKATARVVTPRLD